MRKLLAAAAIAAASWAIRRWLDSRSMRERLVRKPPVETWENEGGALAPHHAAVETSQVAR
jgi:hypothetical protein